MALWCHANNALIVGSVLSQPEGNFGAELCFFLVSGKWEERLKTLLLLYFEDMNLIQLLKSDGHSKLLWTYGIARCTVDVHFIISVDVDGNLDIVCHL